MIIKELVKELGFLLEKIKRNSWRNLQNEFRMDVPEGFLRDIKFEELSKKELLKECQKKGITKSIFEGIREETPGGTDGGNPRNILEKSDKKFQETHEEVFLEYPTKVLEQSQKEILEEPLEESQNQHFDESEKKFLEEFLRELLEVFTKKLLKEFQKNSYNVF